MYTNLIHTAMVLGYLLITLMFGLLQMAKVILSKLVAIDASMQESTLSLANMSFSTPSVLDNESIQDFYFKWGTADEDNLPVFEYTMDDIDLALSIAAYEEEMDLEWEDEIMGYTLSDIVEFMVLDSEDDPYEHMPFQASMRRSAKTNKRGINVVLNCGEERSVHHYNAKDRK